jgi:hypothetical protein
LARSILRERPRFPIIIASGYTLDFAVENWSSNVRSIIKPFTSEDIDALIGQLLKV